MTVPNIQGEVELADVDFTGTANLNERLERIALSTGKDLKVGEVAQLLIDSGQHQTTLKNFRPHVYTALKRHPYFKRVRKGTFTYEKGDSVLDD